LDVAGDPVDFIPRFNLLNANSATYRKIQDIITSLKNDQIVGIRIKLNQIPPYYVKKHDVNAVFKVDLPNAWRLVYGIITIHDERKAIMMEIFNHNSYNNRFGYK
jgi:hypothetical protein